MIIRCPVCEGKGEYTIPSIQNRKYVPGKKYIEPKPKVCPYCNGTGTQDVIDLG